MDHRVQHDVGMVAFVLAFMKQPTKSPLRYPETRLPLS